MHVLSCTELYVRKRNGNIRSQDSTADEGSGRFHAFRPVSKYQRILTEWWSGTCVHCINRHQTHQTHWFVRCSGCRGFMASIPSLAVGFYALTLGPRRGFSTQQRASSGPGGGDRSTGSGGNGGGAKTGGRGPTSFPEFPPPPSGRSWLSIFLLVFGSTLILVNAPLLLYGLLSQQVWECVNRLWLHSHHQFDWPHYSQMDHCAKVTLGPAFYMIPCITKSSAGSSPHYIVYHDEI